MARAAQAFRRPRFPIGSQPEAAAQRWRRQPRRLGLHVLKNKRAMALTVKVPRTLVTPLQTEQVRRYLRGLRRYRDLAIVHLMLLCGLRSREVLGLARTDVALGERTVRVLGKGATERMVPMAELAVRSVEQYLAHERPRCGEVPALFVCLQGKRRGRAMTPAGLRSLFRHRRKKPGLDQANPHRFRHTFGADMARCGLPLPVIQRLMGHANPEMTLQYVNLSMADIAQAYREAAERIRTRYELG